MIPDNFGIVVIGRNEGARLIACIGSVKRKTNNIVYVDSGSTDGSVAAAERLGVSVVRLDGAQPFSAARARNEGFSAFEALGKRLSFVQFIDGDCEMVDGWLSIGLAFIAEREDLAVVCGRRRERHPEISTYNRIGDFEWDTPVGEALGCGGDFIIRVEAFKAVGGFRAELIAGEEVELCLRLRNQGWKIWRLDADMTIHDLAMTRFSQWWYRNVRSGCGCVDISWLHRNAPQSISNWLRQLTSAVFWGGLLPGTIFLGALMHPAALCGVLIYFLQICRIAFAWGPTSSLSWIRALFAMLAKFAEFQGILTFCWRQCRRQTSMLIEYK